MPNKEKEVNWIEIKTMNWSSNNMKIRINNIK
jgi:hypothetical protein